MHKNLIKRVSDTINFLLNNIGATVTISKEVVLHVIKYLTEPIKSKVPPLPFNTHTDSTIIDIDNMLCMFNL